MSAMQLRGSGAFTHGMTNKSSGWSTMKQKTGPLSTQHYGSVCKSFLLVDRNKGRYIDAVGHCSLSTSNYKMLLASSVIRNRKHISTVLKSHISSDYSLPPSNVDESSVTGEDNDLSSSREIYPELIGIASSERNEKELKENTTSQLRTQDVKHELIRLSIPAIAGQVIEPFTQLMETAYIGRLGSTELASAGVSISIFNIVSKLLNIPLLSVATSFVAEDISKNSIKGSISERQQLASVSTALLLAVSIGIFEALALSFGSGPFLDLMGISSVSPMHAPAKRFLSLRALGAPAVVVSLALQGVLRGFKDTKTPVICLGIGNFSAIFLFPILMYYFQLGVTGAAISSVVSQYIVTFLMLWHVNKRVVLLPPRLGSLQFGGYIKSGGFLIGRTLASLTTMTLATSMAARQGPLAMAAHQICLQVWLAVSLITDALAASGQAMIASSVSKGDYRAVKDTTNFVLKIGILTGVLLAAILGVSFSSIATLFTKDAEVLAIARTGILFVSASQPLNALAFIFDGLHYGVSDFPYAAYSMMIVGVISSAFLLYAPSAFGLPGVWSGLSLFMGLRTMAGYIRLLSKNGPWWFLHEDLNRAEEKQPRQVLMWLSRRDEQDHISKAKAGKSVE